MANEMKILITGDASSAMGALEQLSKSVKDSVGKVEGHFGSMGKVLENFAAPIAALTAVLGGGSMFKGSIEATVDFGKEVGKLQRILGTTSTQASALSVAIGDIYGDADGFLAGAAKMTKVLGTNEEAIQKMGVSTRDSNGHFRDMPTLISEINSKLAEYAEGTDRDVAAQKVYGKSYQEMLRYLALTPEVMSAATVKARELGLQLDADGKGAVKDYRAAMNDVGDALQAVKLRVGLEVMPQLTEMGNWFALVAPAAIDGLIGSLRSLSGVFSNTGVQLGVSALALSTIGPLMLGMLVKIPLISLALSTFQVQMALAARAGVTGFAAISGSVQGTAASMVGLINPWVAGLAAIIGVVAAVDHFSKASKRAVEAAHENATATAGQGASARETVIHLEAMTAALGKLTNPTKRAKDEQRDFKMAQAEAMSIGPAYRTETMAQAKSMKDLADEINRVRIAEAIRSLAITENAITTAKKNANGGPSIWGHAAALGMGVTGGFAAGFTKLAEVTANARIEAETQLSQLMADKAKQLAVINGTDGSAGPARSDKDPDPDPQVEKAALITQDQAALQLEALRVDAMASYTLQQQAAKEEAKANLEYTKAAQKLDDDRVSGKYNRAGGDADYLAQMNALRDANILKIAAIKTDYHDKRTAMEEELQGKLSAAEEGGLEKRLDAIRASFAKVRVENSKLAQDGKSFYDEERIRAAQDAAEAQALKDQVQADLAKLKTELSQLAEISGGKATEQDTKVVLDRWKGRGGTKSSAADEYQKQNPKTTAADDYKMGVGDSWLTAQKSMLSGAEGAFSSFFSSLTQKGSTFAQKTKALWQGISGSVVQALTKMGAQELVLWGIGKAKWAWEQMKSGWDTANTTKTVTEGAIKSTANTGEAATGFFKTFAGMGPWGFALAAAAIVGMFALLGSLTGREKGGPVSAGTPYIVGEAGHELFVPDVSGTIIPHHDLTNASANLGANLSRRAGQITALQGQAGDYGAQALANGGGYANGYVDLRGAVIAGESAESARIIAGLIRSGSEYNARRRG